jgi:nickel transport system substrate-binding protein
MAPTANLFSIFLAVTVFFFARRVDALLCSSGTYLSSGSCVVCPQGTTSLGGAVSSSACLPFLAGGPADTVWSFSGDSLEGLAAFDLVNPSGSNGLTWVTDRLGRAASALNITGKMNPNTNCGSGCCGYRMGTGLVLRDRSAMPWGTQTSNLQFTISFWIKTVYGEVENPDIDPENYGAPFGFGTCSGGRQFYPIRAAAAPTLGILGAWGRSIPTNRRVADGKWHHVVVTHKPSTINLVLDGTSCGSTSGFDSFYNDFLVVGTTCETNCWAWNGVIDDIRVYSRVLSNPEIDSLWSFSIPTPSPTASSTATSTPSSSSSSTATSTPSSSSSSSSTATSTPSSSPTSTATSTPSSSSSSSSTATSTPSSSSSSSSTATSTPSSSSSSSSTATSTPSSSSSSSSSSIATNTSSASPLSAALSTVTVVPPTNAGVFSDVQFLNPHAYGPNEISTQNWVYDGLVAYGTDGTIVPALATSWAFSNSVSVPGGVDITFALRQGVTFHDGQPWNAAAAVLNLNNVFSPALAATYHSWYALPSLAVSWAALNDTTLVLTLSRPYSPALTELSIIRPLRFLSPSSFFTGPGENSCPANRGNVTARNVSITCMGIKSPIGTGPWVFERKVTSMGRVMTAANVSFTTLLAGEAVIEISWTRNPTFWGPLPISSRLVVPAGLTSSLIRQRLLDGTLDAAYGATGLLPSDFQALQATPGITALVSPPLQTRMFILNSNDTARATSSVAVRQAINLAINRNSISGAFLSLEQPADRLFAPDTPFCGGDIGPVPVFSVAAANAALEADGWIFAISGDPIRYKAGVKLTVDLVYVDSDSSANAIVPFIVSQLQTVGVEVLLVPLNKAAYQTRMFAGDFALGLTETLGDPYDPTSYVSSWTVPRSYEYLALAGMGARSNVTKGALDALITAALSELDTTTRQALWTSILTAINLDFLFAPLTYMTTRAASRRGVVGLTFGAQQFDFPVGSLDVLTSSSLSSPSPSPSPSPSAPSSSSSSPVALLRLGKGTACASDEECLSDVCLGGCCCSPVAASDPDCVACRCGVGAGGCSKRIPSSDDVCGDTEGGALPFNLRVLSASSPLNSRGEDLIIIPSRFCGDAEGTPFECPDGGGGGDGGGDDLTAAPMETAAVDVDGARYYVVGAAGALQMRAVTCDDEGESGVPTTPSTTPTSPAAAFAPAAAAAAIAIAAAVPSVSMDPRRREFSAGETRTGDDDASSPGTFSAAVPLAAVALAAVGGALATAFVQALISRWRRRAVASRAQGSGGWKSGLPILVKLNPGAFAVEATQAPASPEGGEGGSGGGGGGVKGVPPQG